MSGSEVGGGRKRALARKRAWQAVFLAELAKGSTVTDAAATAGVTRVNAYLRRDEDPEFAVAWEDAYEQGTDVFEREAKRRAVDGVEKPIMYRGQVATTVREFSDGLLELALKARRPGRYRERFDVRHSGQISRPNAEQLAAEREAGLDDEMEATLAKVASLDAARQRRSAAG